MLTLEAMRLPLALPLFMLVAARLAALLMFLPPLTGSALPARFRVGLVLGLAALVTPLVSLPEGLPITPAGLAIALGGELLVGAVHGLVIRACFTALEIGGQLIAQESGLAFGQVADPATGANNDVLSTVYVQMALVLYLVVDGHRALVAAVLDTFAHAPLATLAMEPDAAMGLLTAALLSGLEFALRVAAPVVLTLMLVNLALGFVGRVIPQLNVTALAFSVKGVLALLIMAAALPGAMNGFDELLMRSIDLLQE